MIKNNILIGSAIQNFNVLIIILYERAKKVTKLDSFWPLKFFYSFTWSQPRTHNQIVRFLSHQALDLVPEKQTDDFQKFLVNVLLPEPIDNDIDIAVIYPTDDDDFMLPLLSNTDLFSTSDNNRKRTRSSLITNNETLIDNSFTDSDSQSENLNLNRAQNKKSRKWFFTLVGGVLGKEQN